MRNFGFKRYTSRSKKLLRASLKRVKKVLETTCIDVNLRWKLRTLNGYLNSTILSPKRYDYRLRFLSGSPWGANLDFLGHPWMSWHLGMRTTVPSAET